MWGSNEQGQLGLGDRVQRNAPTELVALSGAKVAQMSGSFRQNRVLLGA